MFDKLVDLVVNFIHLFFFCFTTASYERGVVLRFGLKHRDISPGFHWIWPFHIEQYYSCSIAVETATVGPQSLTTKDDKSIVVSTIITFEVADSTKFLLEVEGGHQVIEDSAYGAVADFVMKRTWNQLREIEDINNDLSKLVRRKASKYGVNIISAQLCDFTASKSLRLIQPLGHHSHTGM
jgi:regulator of protease activity HflC (stomatin/prohibitin superfamily)